MICQLSVVTEGKKGKVKIWIVDGVSYIDYRYSTDSELSGLNYDKWLDDFYLVYNFLTDIKHNI